MIGDNRDDLVLAAGATMLVVMGAAAYSLRQKRSHSAAVLSSIVARDLEGATVCITGGNSGIGRSVALALGQRGANVLIGCRNLETAKNVSQVLGEEKCHVFSLDLANAASVETFSENIRNATVRTGLQVLINNAGAMINERDKRSSIDDGGGWDTSMAVNHLGWVQLTRNLLPILEKTAEKANNSNDDNTKPVRIVNVGSILEKRASLPDRLDDPAAWDEWIKTSVDPYGPFPAYANAKMAMTAVTFHWSQLLREETSKVEMMIVSPGMVNTALSRFMPLWKRVFCGRCGNYY